MAVSHMGHLGRVQAERGIATPVAFATVNGLERPRRSGPTSVLQREVDERGARVVDVQLVDDVSSIGGIQTQRGLPFDPMADDLLYAPVQRPGVRRLAEQGQ